MQWMIHGAKNDEEEEWFLCFGASLGPVFPIYVPMSQISFNWLPRRREWLCCFFLLCVSESTSHHLQLRKKPVWFDSDAANLIFYFDWILWKIALENLMRFSNIFQFSWSAIAFFFLFGDARFVDAHDRELSTFGFRNNVWFSFVLWLPCLAHGNWPIEWKLQVINKKRKRSSN